MRVEIRRIQNHLRCLTVPCAKVPVLGSTLFQHCCYRCNYISLFRQRQEFPALTWGQRAGLVATCEVEKRQPLSDVGWCAWLSMLTFKPELEMQKIYILRCDSEPSHQISRYLVNNDRFQYRREGYVSILISSFDSSVSFSVKCSALFGDATTGTLYLISQLLDFL